MFYLDLALWANSITNMLWWSFSSSIGISKLYECFMISLVPNHLGNPVMLKEKIYSLLGHMTNKHEFEENSLHKKCDHPPLADRAWLSTNSKVGCIKLVRKIL